MTTQERGTRVALSYRRAHVLAVDGGRWDVQAVWELLGNPPVPQSRIRFDLELSDLTADAGDWQGAMARSRAFGNHDAQLDGVPLQIRLETVELHFATLIDQVEPYGTASFSASVSAPIAFPRALDDAGFVAALAKAAAMSSGNPIQADEIETREHYWIFPVTSIGGTGVIFDRRTGTAFETGGSMDRDLWIWGYEHGFLGDPSCDLVVDQVVDRDRAFAALKAFARVRRVDLETLPLVLSGCATWMAIRPLFDAEGALAWRVARP